MVMKFYEDERNRYDPPKLPKIEAVPTPLINANRYSPTPVIQEAARRRITTTVQQGGKYEVPVQDLFRQFGGGPSEQQPVASYIQNPYTFWSGSPWTRGLPQVGTQATNIHLHPGYPTVAPRKYQPGDPWVEPDLTWGNIKPAIYDYTILPEPLYNPADYIYGDSGGGDGGYTYNFGGSGTPSSGARYYGTGLINWRV